MLRYIFVLCIARYANSQTNPIQPPISVLGENPGFVYNNGVGKVRVDVFLETLCSDSSRAWPVLKQVAEFYGPEKLTLAVHQFPLPYHRNAFLCTQGFYQVADKQPDKLFDYMEAVFENMIFFVGSLTRNNTEFEITNWLSIVAEQATGLDAKDFADNINSYIGPAIYNWKYATRRSVSGTPWYFVNNVDLGVNPGKFVSFESWKSFLDPLMEQLQNNKIDANEVNDKNMYNSLEEQNEPNPVVKQDNKILTAVRNEEQDTQLKSESRMNVHSAERNRT